MNMLRHHHISQQREIIALSNFTENFEKEIPSPLGTQQRCATITTACYKVQLAQPIAASQALLHPENTNPSYPEGFGTPHGSWELSSELVVWYYPPGRHVNEENIGTKGFATRQWFTADATGSVGKKGNSVSGEVGANARVFEGSGKLSNIGRN